MAADVADLHAHSLALVSAGRLEEAGRLLDDALARVVDPGLRADLVATAAWVRGETGDLAGATSLCEHALVDPLLEPGARAVLTARLAALKVRAGDDDAALPLFDAAVPDLDDHPETRGRALINRGYLYLRRRELAAAAADLDRAEEAFAQVGDEVERAKVRHNRGYVDLLAGDLVGALGRMNAARSTLRDLSPAHRAICDLDRAEVLEAAGLAGEAIETLETVVESLSGAAEWHTLADAELTLARFLVGVDPGRAIDLATHASSTYREQGNATAALRAVAAAAHASIVHASTPTPRPETLDELADALDARHLVAEGDDLRIRAAEAALQEGDPEAAGRRIARLSLDEDAPMRTRLLATTVGTELRRRAGRPSDALREAAGAMDEFARWQESFGSLSLQVATQQRVHDLVVQGLRAAWETGEPEQVLAWSERARGTAAAWNPVRVQDAEVSAALAELREIGDPADAASAERRAALRERVRERGWTGRVGPATARGGVGLHEVERALAGADASMVTFLWMGDRVVALTLDDGAQRLHDLGPWDRFEALVAGLPADLDMAAARLGPALRRLVRASLDDRLAALDRMLLAPLAGDLSHRRVVLTVPGILGGVPWALMPSLVGRSLSVPVSAGWWVGSRATPRTVPASVAVVAGPGTEHGEDEARAVAAAWADRSAVLSGPDATAGRAQALATASDVLHVCAHGGHSTEHPLFSSLGLADGPWFGHDVEQLSSVPDLVVVSACEMGRSVGEYDTLGMARAWLHSGARCVVAAPASVSDVHAADLFPRVHARIARGAAPGDALADELGDAPAVPVLCYGNAF